MPLKDALASEYVVDTTKEVIKTVMSKEKHTLKKSEFVNAKFNAKTWQLLI